MSIYESSEDYLERILMLENEIGSVRSIDIANSFSYSRASVSRAMKILKESSCITINERGIIALTQKGRAIAMAMLERHELMSDFLKSLGVSEKTALDDACKMEHAISDESFEAIKEYLKSHHI